MKSVSYNFTKIEDVQRSFCLNCRNNRCLHDVVAESDQSLRRQFVVLHEVVVAPDNGSKGGTDNLFCPD